MANTFKNASLQNVSNSSYDTLYTAPAATTTVILGVALCNKSASGIVASLRFTDNSGSTNTMVLNEVNIPGDTTLEVLAGQKYILETGDSLALQAGSASALDVTLGIMEIT